MGSRWRGDRRNFQAGSGCSQFEVFPADTRAPVKILFADKGEEVFTSRIRGGFKGIEPFSRTRFVEGPRMQLHLSAKALRICSKKICKFC